MKVCHITSVHPRDDSRIFYKECVSLANNGYDVTLLVSGTGKKETVNHIEIVPVGATFKNRIDRIRRSNKLFYGAAADINADFYHIHDPELIPVGIRLKKRGKTVIFDSHEDIPMTIYDKHWIPRPLRKYISGIYKIYEANQLKKYDALISVTPVIVERLKRINKKTELVTNYPTIDLSNHHIPEDGRQLVKKDIAFAGLIGPLYNHDVAIKAVQKAGGLHYKLAGKSNDLSYLESLKNLDGWTIVDFRGMIPHSNVHAFYKASMVGISISNHDLNGGGEEGSLGVLKNFEIMAAGIPLICSDTRVWKEIIGEFDCGICVAPRNVDEVASAIKFLKDNPDRAKEMGKNGRKAIEMKYNWTTQEKVLLQLYNHLSKAGSLG